MRFWMHFRLNFGMILLRTFTSQFRHISIEFYFMIQWILIYVITRQVLNAHIVLQVSLAIGFLFIGGGMWTFSTSNCSIAALLITLYPRLPTGPNDNRCHLQVRVLCGSDLLHYCDTLCIMCSSFALPYCLLSCSYDTQCLMLDF